MGSCTGFCARLEALSLENGVLPSHARLISHFQFTDEDKQRGRTLGVWRELQRRTDCDFCQLVVATATEGASLGEERGPSPDQPVSVFIFPGEQSFRLSSPSILGVRLAFVADEGIQASGPDTARLVRGTEIQVSKITQWLRACDESHDSCTLGTPRMAKVLLPPLPQTRRRLQNRRAHRTNAEN